jgi:hypothetical protein
MPGANVHGETQAAQGRRGAHLILKEAWPLDSEAGGHADGIEDQQMRSGVSP